MTQTQLADWLGVTQKHASHLETGFRPAGPQTVRLLDILAERVKSGEANAVQPRKSRRESKPTIRRVTQ
jgi:hypothetical protein